MWPSRTARASVATSRAYVSFICVLLLIANCLPYVRGRRVGGGKKRERGRERDQSEAIERLSRVFGIEQVPEHQFYRKSPPQFMVELFQDITDSGGLIKKEGPYNASTIVSFPDRAYNREMHFYYNVSLHSDERLLESEFHVFRMSPKPNNTGTRQNHLIELKIYQVLDADDMHSADGKLLLDARRVSVHVRGWLIFNVTAAVRAWASGEAVNHGLLVSTQTIYGGDLGENAVRFAQRKSHHESKQPILVIYTNNGKTRTPSFISPEDQDYKEIKKDIKRQERRYEKRHKYQYDNAGLQTAIRLLNEKDREEYGHPFFVGAVNSSASRNSGRLSRRKRDGQTNNIPETVSGKVAKRTRRKSRRQRDGKRDIGTGYSKPRRSCSRRQMYVDFDEIGWAGWIISPKGYNAYHCKGECPFPLGQSQKPTNHATVQSIVHALRVAKGVSTPCCVPNKLYSISLLYFDDSENVILKQYDDMVAASCGCH